MRSSLLLFLLLSINAFSFNAFSSNVYETCMKDYGTEVFLQASALGLVDGHCVAQDYVDSKTSFDKELVENFLKLEKEVGETIWDLNHVNQAKLYRVKGYKYQKRNIEVDELVAYAKFGLEELGVHTYEDIFGSPYYDILDSFRGAKSLNKAQLKSFLERSFSKTSVDADDYRYDDIQGIKEKFEAKNALYANAVEELANLITNNGAKEATLYPLLDNNNENVQDAQWVVMGRDYAMLLNRFWYL